MGVQKDSLAVISLVYRESSTWQPVSIGVRCPTPMDNRETIWLHRYGPSGEPWVCVLHSLQPGKRFVVSLNCEWLPIQVYVEKLQDPDNCEALLLNRWVLGLPGQELATCESNRMLLYQRIMLTEDSSKAPVIGIRLEDVGLCRASDLQGECTLKEIL